MKSVVVEIRDDFAAILTDDGCITKIKNHNYTIGQVIELKKNTIFKTKKFAACAAATVLVLLGLSGGFAYASPYTYVSLDVNPSIQFTVNRFDRVLRVKAVNDDGEEILKEIQLSDLENQTINQALTSTVGQIAEEGYFDVTAEGGLVITTAGENNDKSEEMAEDLKESVEKTLKETDKVVEVEAISVGLERVKEAAKLGVTPGKLNLVQKLIASSENPDSIVLEEWLNKPVKEIMSAIKANKKAAKADISVTDGQITAESGSASEKETTDSEDGNTTETTDETSAIANAFDSNSEAVLITDETDSEDVSIEAEKTAEQKAAEKAAKDKKKADKTAAKEISKTSKETEKITAASARETSKINKDSKKAKETAEKEVDKAKEAAETKADKAKEAAEKESINKDKSSVASKSVSGDINQELSDESSANKDNKDFKEDTKSSSVSKSDKNDSKSENKSNKSKGN